MPEFKYDPVTHMITNELAVEAECSGKAPEQKAERERLEPEPETQQAPAGTPPNGDFPDVEPSAESSDAAPKRSSNPKTRDSARTRAKRRNAKPSAGRKTRNATKRRATKRVRKSSS
jgi:hypothetical protein